MHDFDLVIGPSRSWSPRLDEVWAYRELLLFLVWRDFKVRYRQTVLGVLWAVIQPLAAMVVFTIVFGGFAKVPSDGLPYPLFSFAALVPWAFFATGLTRATESVVSNSNLIQKVYFPRLVIPIAAVLGGSIDFVVSFVLLVILAAYFGVAPGWSVVWLPAFLVLAFVTALGVGLWLSALNVRFRDVRHTMGFLMQMWLFCTPIVYPSSMLPEPWRTLSGLNPMAGVVEGFRWALLDTAPPGPLIGVSAAAALVLLVTGALYFRRMEGTFADRV